MGAGLVIVTPPVPGSQVSVVQYGKPVADDVNLMGKKPFAWVQSTAGTSYASATSSVEMGMTGVLEDTDNMTNISSSNRLTIRTPGLYTFRGQIPWVTNATGWRSVEVWRNGSNAANTLVRAADTAGTRIQVELTTRCVAGDSFWLQGCQNSGVSLATDTGVVAQGVWFQAIYEGA